MDEHEPGIHSFDTFISDEELIDDYNEKEGTRLDPAKMHRNQSGGIVIKCSCRHRGAGAP